jgi:ABC-2 type transport system ATP-binding protein
MDEAERCHEIAYIAYGHLLAHGTVAEIIAQSQLSTFVVSGDDLAGLAETLKQTPGVDMVAPFGARLHVASRDAAALDRVAEKFAAPGLVWERDAPNLEDVFIDMMSRAQDNYS